MWSVPDRYNTTTPPHACLLLYLFLFSSLTHHCRPIFRDTSNRSIITMVNLIHRRGPNELQRDHIRLMTLKVCVPSMVFVLWFGGIEGMFPASRHEGAWVECGDVSEEGKVMRWWDSGGEMWRGGCEGDAEERNITYITTETRRCRNSSLVSSMCGLNETRWFCTVVIM